MANVDSKIHQLLDRNRLPEGKFVPRDPMRIDFILEKIAEAWRKDPDLRLTQLILNCRKHELGENAYKAMYNMEEYELLAQLQKIYGV